ncbi:response regulator [Myxococcota bacterium]|nr:response regulator [Myxococcota bacterium]
MTAPILATATDATPPAATEPATVLLVDDDANLRSIVREALVPQGLRVLEASTLQAARALLDCVHPEVLVVDGSLPDGEGLELLAELRETGRSPATIYITAHEQDLSRVRALRAELGIRLVVGKPLSLAELALQVQALARRAERGPGVRPPPPGAAPVLDLLGSLRQGYRAELCRQLQVLATGARAVAQRSGDPRALELLAHRVHGTAGTYGFPGASLLAGQVEAALIPSSSPAEGVEAALLRLAGQCEALRAELERQAPAESPAPEPSAEHRVLLVHPDRGLRAELARIGTRNGLAVHEAGSEAEAIGLALRAPPTCAIVATGLPQGDDPMRCIRRLRSLPSLGDLRVALLSDHDEVSRRVDASRARVDLFEVAPMGAMRFLDVVRRLRLGATSSLSVLLVEDDPDFARAARQVLELHGMAVHVLQDPTRILDTLDDRRPDLVLLDLVMPALSGFDVCRLIRTTARWCELPIVVVTSRLSADVRIAAFQAGADDYVAKPVVAEELVARVKGRAQRARLQLEAREHDGLTDLLLRRPFVERVEQTLALGRRTGMPVTVALIDLDHFKQVNDQHGHLVGDQVLAVMGQVLRNHTRAEDRCARWGGEEFAVAFVNAEPDAARLALDRIQAQFTSLRFQGDDGVSFQVSFSAGLACSTTHGADLVQLLRVADEHLYAAKEAGRRRICA